MIYSGRPKNGTMPTNDTNTVVSANPNIASMPAVPPNSKYPNIASNSAMIIVAGLITIAYSFHRFMILKCKRVYKCV